LELQALNKMMKPPNDTYAAVHNGVYKKKGTGVFLHNVFKNLEETASFRATRKIFNAYQDAVKEDYILSGMYRWCNNSALLAQLYVNGDYYKAHWDTPILTHITLMHTNPKKFTGGGLLFPEFDHHVELENNQSILFPSFMMHEVKQVMMDSEEPHHGRYTLTNFMHFVNPTHKSPD
jgi:Rps23 Pro-64 3,4-dihydroxylase Tpa1-like proline 4-hydroxylase